MSNRRNISLPDELDDKLDAPHLNASGLIQDLLRAYFAYGDADEAAEHVHASRTDDRERRLLEAVQTLATIEKESQAGHLDRYNDAVLKQASKLEIPPDQLLEHVREYLEFGEVEA